MKTIIVSLGGSVYYPQRFRKIYIQKFAKILKKFSATYNYFIVCGGGASARRNIQKISADDEEKDLAGIRAINENAEKVLAILKEELSFFKQVIKDPSEIKNKHANFVFGASIPGHSTDWVAVKIAEKLQIKEVVNISNIDKIYDRDPALKQAQPFDEITWNSFFRIIGTDFKPGGHYPFDPIASKIAHKNNIVVYNINGNKLSKFEAFLDKGFSISLGTKIF